MLDNRKYYWGTTRKAIIAFGNLFNNLSIVREDAKGVEVTVKVPLSYAPKDKFLSRITQQPDIENKTVALVVPRMAFEIGKMSLDPSRMQNKNNSARIPVGGTVAKKYSPVPYNLTVNLFVYTKTQDEGLQIMEQILPNFRPSYALSMNSIPEFGLKEDLHVILTDVDMEDTYEGSMSEKRAVFWTFSFVLQLNYHPAADDPDRGLIRRTEVGFFGDRLLTREVGEIVSELVPFNANPNGNFEIATTFEGFD